jgi:hypothetical protein
VATYTGWNLRDQSIGNQDLFIGITGGLAGWTLPFPATPEDRQSSGDLRLSIKERYESKEEYLKQVEAAVQSLIDEGYFLVEDLREAMDRASRKYDYFSGKNHSS